MRRRILPSGRREPLKKAQARSRAAMAKARKLTRRKGETKKQFASRQALAKTRAKLY